jgi:esterase/lipase
MTYCTLNKHLNKPWKKALAFIVMALIALRVVGFFLDQEAERTIGQLFELDADGIIKGAEAKSYQNNHKRALALIHGHMETPGIWEEIFDKGKSLDSFDIYTLLMPYHGKTLQIAKELNNQVVYEHFKTQIAALAKKYEKITVVGLSYGGLQLAILAKNNDLPENVNVVLYGPATHILTNDFLGLLTARFYQFGFRDYCNYDHPPLFPCKYPVLESGDDMAQETLKKEISLRYRVIPAIAEMYVLDNASRGVIKNIKRSFSILIAKDDNRVNYEIIKEECSQNSHCSLTTFPSGKHVIHYGKWKNEWFKGIVERTLGD